MSNLNVVSGNMKGERSLKLLLRTQNNTNDILSCILFSSHIQCNTFTEVLDNIDS